MADAMALDVAVVTVEGEGDKVLLLPLLLLKYSDANLRTSSVQGERRGKALVPMHAPTATASKRQQGNKTNK